MCFSNLSFWIHRNCPKSYQDLFFKWGVSAQYDCTIQNWSRRPLSGSAEDRVGACQLLNYILLLSLICYLGDAICAILFSCPFTFEWWGNNRCCRSIYSVKLFHQPFTLKYTLCSPTENWAVFHEQRWHHGTLYLQWVGFVCFLTITIGGGKLPTNMFHWDLRLVSKKHDRRTEPGGWKFVQLQFQP